MPGQLWKASRNILLSAGGVFVALILLEVGSRLLPPPYDESGNPVNQCSSLLGWRGRSHFEATVATDDYVHDLKLNSAGMHDGEHPFSKPANTYRILMIGDSFIRAHQVKEAETSHQVLEDLLNSGDVSQHFEVISAGVDGWGTGQELLYYRSEGRFYQPDLVLLAFYMGNDLEDNLPGRGLTLDGRNCYTSYFVLCGDQLDPDPWFYAPGLKAPTGECPSGRKLLNNMLGRLYQSSHLYQRMEPLFAVGAPKVAALDYYTQGNERYDYALRLTLTLIKQFDEEVKNDGAEFAVILISPQELVDFTRMSSSEREAVYQRLPFMRRAEDIDPPNQFFTDALAREGVRVLDLLPSFVEYIDKTGETLQFQQDKHWNVAGNRLAGESIGTWLQ